MGGASRFVGSGVRDRVQGGAFSSSEVRFQEEEKHCTRFCQVCDPVSPLLLPPPPPQTGSYSPHPPVHVLKESCDYLYYGL